MTTAPPVADDCFAGAMQQAPAAMAVVTGHDHTLVYHNRAFDALAAGAPGAPPAVGTPITAALSPAAGAALGAVLDAVRRTGRPGRGLLPAPSLARTLDAADVDVTRPAASDDGATGDVWPCTAWSVAALAGQVPTDQIVVALDTSAAAVRARLEHRDVTERVLLRAFDEGDRADVAEAARAVAEVANAARAAQLATTSHELRTPLQAIGGYAEMLDAGLHGPVTDKQRGSLARIQQAMQHLVDLTTTLLDHAKLEAGRVVYALAAVPVQQALDDAAALVTPQAGAKGITVAVVPGPAGLTAHADPGKVRQVLLNLLANAVKFTAPGGAVTLSSATAAAGRTGRSAGAAAPSEDASAAPAAVVLAVTDTGRGIAADQLALVFDPYVQVGRRVSTREGGVGLGLAISRDLARGMGGDLTAESAPGVGSTFTLTLPAA
ncbi:hypothetical protein tb265_06980 [Gemmatimonadetes bacterium T265]|nr:hypothetical protein tb265_06980 [Gemmatimonadetes bacterium T265]